MLIYIYDRKGRLTIGDDMQLLAIENLYGFMGIDYNNVVSIGYHELNSYDGKMVILPILFPFYGYQRDCEVLRKNSTCILGFKHFN